MCGEAKGRLFSVAHTPSPRPGSCCLETMSNRQSAVEAKGRGQTTFVNHDTSARRQELVVDDANRKTTEMTLNWCKPQILSPFFAHTLQRGHAAHPPRLLGLEEDDATRPRTGLAQPDHAHPRAGSQQSPQRFTKDSRRRRRKWCWSTTLRSLAELAGALKNLPVSHGRGRMRKCRVARSHYRGCTRGHPWRRLVGLGAASRHGLR